ncbi:hypothetical protein BN59_00401 [Legionella massiliensis]|uniref:Uncharacterized protein n=1 Tax=Legionella massiliensis TaxID=1034943 RepID=A0A078KP30_9GAMM|nr:hypothetical protein BN59_00401 [Legionella massiliensis]CEE11873.1 hypothetical protein BN1094_00401 [Legionella massiliensis]
MARLKKSSLRNLNRYSWSILIAFICANFSMQYHAPYVSFEGFLQTFPLIVLVVFRCERLAPLISQPEYHLNKQELFLRDSFILSFSFLLACLISLLFQYDNSDVRGWWSFIIYLFALYGLFFSLTFSIMALLIKNHKRYTLIFSFLIIFFISLGKFFPHYISIPLIGEVDSFFAFAGSLLIFHCLFAISYKIACKL